MTVCLANNDYKRLVCYTVFRLKAALLSPFLLVTMRAYWPASAEPTSRMSRPSLVPLEVRRYFMGCSFTSRPS